MKFYTEQQKAYEYLSAVQDDGEVEDLALLASAVDQLDKRYIEGEIDRLQALVEHIEELEDGLDNLDPKDESDMDDLLGRVENVIDAFNECDD